MGRQYKIKEVTTNNPEKVDDRKVFVTLENDTEIEIISQYESWAQYGGTKDELYSTVPIADIYNDWLHGGSKPELSNCDIDWIKDEEYDDDLREEIVDLFKENGYNLFEGYSEEIARTISDEVLQELKEQGEGNLQKAIAYVILDKFGAFD